MTIVPYYQDEKAGITIYCGDARTILPSLPKCDLLLTDPPYGINHSSSWDSSWQDTTIQGDSDTSVRDAVVLQFAEAAVFGTWKTPPIDGVRGCLVWDKGPASGMGDLSFPWKPSWELVYIRGESWTGRRDEGVLRSGIVVTWESKGRFHPHQKPVGIVKQILDKAPKAALICDPFMGSGTTLVAAKLLGRRAIGIEIEERYCEIAVNRLRQGVLEFSS